MRLEDNCTSSRIEDFCSEPQNRNVKTKDGMEIYNIFLNVSPKKNRETGLRLRFLKTNKITERSKVEKNSFKNLWTTSME